MLLAYVMVGKYLINVIWICIWLTADDPVRRATLLLLKGCRYRLSLHVGGPCWTAIKTRYLLRPGSLQDTTLAVLGLHVMAQIHFLPVKTAES